MLPQLLVHVDFQFPRLADTLVEGTVTHWLKSAGDRVRKGEPLVEVETDKVNSELESPIDGVVVEIVVPEGETAAVGAVLARIEPGEDANPSAGEVTRPGQAPVPTPQGGGLSPMRSRIAERMQEARATIPQGACVREFDLSAVRREGSWTAYFVKALAEAAGIERVGVAVEVPGGLVAPVVAGAAGRTPRDISAEIAGLAERARENRLEPAEVSGAGFTVSNLGGGGTLMAFPLVSPGQPGVLAPGAVRPDGRCFVTLCYDRRTYDDHAADRLLAGVERAMSGL